MRIVFLLLAAALVVSSASAQVPKGVIAEDATATWCTYCPYAYAGLEVMKSRYDTNEFTSTRIYSTSGGGGLSNAEITARVNWYGVSGFPTVFFDGGNAVVGGSTFIATGAAYDPIVINGIAQPSPLAIRINSVDLVQPSGSINFDVIVSETMASIANHKIRVYILENSVLYGSTTHTDVIRDILPDQALTVSVAGQTQNVVHNFAVDPAWKTSDLWAVVFIQNDTDKSILQSESTRLKPAYSPRFWAKGPRAAVGPSSGTHHFQDFAVFNQGTSPDNITVTLNQTHLPSGWSAVFTDGVNDYPLSTALSLNPGDSRRFHIKVTPTSPGYADLKIVLTTPNLVGWSRTIGYTFTTNNVQVLLVKDDGGTTFENYYLDALTAYGCTFGLWNANYGNATAADLAPFPVVFWEVGLAYPTLTDSDRAALGSYLDGGGKLFINGQDFGWEMNDIGGAALAWYNTYMHANYVIDDTNRYNLTGTPGDPITNGMTITIQGGDGANNQEYPDAINPRDAAASIIFSYDGTSYKGGIKVDTGVYKVVYLGFGYEAISTQANRRLLVQRILQWFGIQPMDVGDEAGAIAASAIRAFPNPAYGPAEIRFNLPASGGMRVQVYALDGSLVRTLFDGIRPAGSGSLRWDGRNDAGNPVSSGVYFVRMTSPGRTAADKLILTR